LPGHDIIVVGASAGGVEALMTLVRALPANLPATVCIVLHLPAQSPSMLPSILERAGPLPALQAHDGAPIRHRQIYVAPPDHHLLIERGRLRVIHGPRENRHRPAIDPLFRSAACAYGSRVLGVILTGSLDDGTAGMQAVKQRGGIAIVQDPREALYPSMPRSAIENVAVDYCLPLAEIGPLLAQLASEPADENGAPPVPEEMEREIRVTEMDMTMMTSDDHPGAPSAFSCPECGGVLWELRDGDLIRFRCRTGHAYSPESMLEGQTDVLEEALWVALKTLEENVSLSRRLGKQARDRGHHRIAARFDERVQDAEQRIALIKQVLINDQPMAATDMLDDDVPSGNGSPSIQETPHRQIN
jgi:two-component system, chemotaxis family, protein-glutamate methylesterase/glutaminase